MKIGMVGLGKMGGSMAKRLRDHGHEVVGYDMHSDATDVPTLEALVEALPKPRVVWVMVPAGEPTEHTVVSLASLLEADDVLVEGGNSNWRDSVRQAEMLAKAGIGYVDAGTSGGVWGLSEGYCLMVGGTDEHVATVQPIFDALAPPHGFVHTGAAGTGHFTKMVHNGIEYGMLQAYAEGFEILEKSQYDFDLEAVSNLWNQGSVVRSWLLELAERAFANEPHLESVAGYVNDSGEGRWTVQEAINEDVPAPVITESLYARFASRQDESFAAKSIAALRQQFGGHTIKEAGARESE